MIGRTLFAGPRLLQDSVRRASNHVRVVEVGARDGLQNEKNPIATADKLELIRRLVAAGLKTVEATSFVSPKWVPQMADHIEIVNGLEPKKGVSYPVLVPNEAGLERALATGRVQEIAVFGAASESFSKKNVNDSVEGSLRKLETVTKKALERGVRVRGYISCVIGCPYDGKIQPSVVAKVLERVLAAGCYEVSLGDTIGVGSAGSVKKLLLEVEKVAPVEKLAVHFHDTYGQALANVLVALERGIRVADASVGGLGGCPYAPGATGNLATEDLVYMLHDLGFETGVALDDLVETSRWINERMGRTNASRASSAILRKKAKTIC